MRTSDQLELGALYSRAELREQFEIADQTINTGIFQPAGHDSVWLFVTERKEAGMTAYADRMEGDVLHWQGQTAGLKDDLIIEHETLGLELLLFYRETKDAYPGYAFRYEGPFEYRDHHGSGPATFRLERASAGERSEALAVDSLAEPVTPTVGEASTDTVGSASGARDEPDPCLVEVLASLRQSGAEAVVADGTLTRLQQLMHVPDQIEDWVAERVASWRATRGRVPLLLVLSGNAGDGKSDLIERLRGRPGILGSDVEVVADATHAESPSQSQAERLVQALELFQSDPVEPTPEPRCVLVAINVGMVIAFFSGLEALGRSEGFGRLRSVLEGDLGLAREREESPAHWDCEVVNLDHRNLLGTKGDGLFAGMLKKLDPENEESITFDAAARCIDCPVRSSCWVRTNLNLIRQPSVQQGLHELLWEVSLSGDIHLSPRNVWDLLFQVVTGGPHLPGGDYLSSEWMRDNLPSSAQELDVEKLRLVHRRLLYHLMFEPPGAECPPRGALLDGLAATDPIRRSGRHTHVTEGEVLAAPQTDRDRFGELALECSEPISEGRRLDPLLAGLAELVGDPVIWQEDEGANRRDLAFGVSRRARLTGMPAEIQAEVSDTSVAQFLDLLSDYATWRSQEDASASVEDFWQEELIGGVSAMFGVEVEGSTYFRLDTLSPTTRFLAFVPVDLPEKLQVVPDPVADSGAAWLEPLAYLPHAVTATISAGAEESWPVPVDLQLFRLLRDVNRGYSASSVDLEAFFRLRYACERLGATDASGEIVFRAVHSGEVFRLREERKLTGKAISFARI